MGPPPKPWEKAGVPQASSVPSALPQSSPVGTSLAQPFAAPPFVGSALPSYNGLGGAYGIGGGGFSSGFQGTSAFGATGSPYGAPFSSAYRPSPFAAGPFGPMGGDPTQSLPEGLASCLRTFEGAMVRCPGEAQTPRPPHLTRGHPFLHTVLIWPLGTAHRVQLRGSAALHLHRSCVPAEDAGPRRRAVHLYVENGASVNRVWGHAPAPAGSPDTAHTLGYRYPPCRHYHAPAAGRPTSRQAGQHSVAQSGGGLETCLTFGGNPAGTGACHGSWGVTQVCGLRLPAHQKTDTGSRRPAQGCRPETTLEQPTLRLST